MRAGNEKTVSCKSEAVEHTRISQIIIEGTLTQMKKYVMVAKPRCLYLKAALRPVSLGLPQWTYRSIVQVSMSILHKMFSTHEQYWHQLGTSRTKSLGAPSLNGNCF